MRSVSGVKMKQASQGFGFLLLVCVSPYIFPTKPQFQFSHITHPAGNAHLNALSLSFTRVHFSSLLHSWKLFADRSSQGQCQGRMTPGTEDIPQLRIGMRTDSAVKSVH